MIRIVSSLIAISVSTTALACDLDSIVERSDQLVEQGRHYSAIKWLNTNQTDCNHPRLELELGHLYQLIGDNERAIAIWQQTLETHSLPESVARKVKLRIIQTSLDAQVPLAGQLIASADHEYHSVDGHSSGANVSAAGQLTFDAANVAGYRVIPELNAQLTSRQAISWQPTQYTPVLLLKTGVAANTTPLSLSMSSSFYLVNEELLPALEMDVEMRFGRADLNTMIEFRPSTERWRWRESLTWNGDLIRTRLSNTLLYDATQWSWAEVKGSLQAKWTWRPELSAAWQPADNRVDLDGSVRWPISKAFWVTLSGGSSLAETTDFSAKLSLNWQPFH